MRNPRPDESVPVELVGKANPNINFSGRDVLTFPPRPGDGRRIEWTTPQMASVLTSALYNREREPPLFRVAEDLRPQNLDIDQRVLEAIRKHAGEIVQILRQSEESRAGRPRSPQAPDPEPPKPPDDPESLALGENSDLDSMSKEELISYARLNRISVDARWNQDKILEKIQRHQPVEA